MNQTGYNPVRIGVVGMGNFGRLHARTIRGLTEARLVAVVARRQASLDAVTEELPGVTGWLDLDQAVAESNAEAWVVASSSDSHVPLTRALLEAGKTVLLEKPIANDAASARSLAPLVRDDSSNLMMGHILLFNSEFIELRTQAARRGAIRLIDCVRHRPTTVLTAMPGEDPFHLTMVHDLYSAMALTDSAEPAHFSAQVHRTPDGAIDLVLAQLRWPSGAIGSFTASFMTVPGMPGDGFDRMEVFADGWAARIQANPRPLELWDDKARWPLELEIRADPQAPAGMLAEELRCFCRVVRGTQSVPIGARYHDALRIQHWLERLEQCAGESAP